MPIEGKLNFCSWHIRPHAVSIYRFAQIVHESGVHRAPVLVWSPRGRLLTYR